jgi:hypothetical protein
MIMIIKYVNNHDHESKMKSAIITRWLLALIALLYLALPNARPDFTVYNSHDSESYIALAQNLLEGRGYTRSLNEREFIPHTLWPPGMAVVLTPAVLLSGDKINFYYVKYSLILIALLGLLLTRQYLLALIKKEYIANWVVILIALNPYFWHFSRIAMAEIPVYTWTMLGLLLVERNFRTPNSSSLKLMILGAFIGLGMLLKGALIGLILAPIPYMWRRGIFSVQSIKQGATYAICFCIPFMLWMYSNQHIDRTNLGLDGVNQIQMITKKVIEDPQSDFKTPTEILTTAKQNILWHAIYHIPNHSIPGVFLIKLTSLEYGNALALLLSLFVLTVVASQFSLLSALILAVIPAALLISVMTIGGAERYWFTITSVLFIPFYLIIYRIPQSMQKFVILSLVSIQLIGLSYFVYQHEQSPYTEVESRHELAELFLQAIPMCEQEQFINSNTWTKNEHAFQLMTGCKASMVNVAIGISPQFSHAILYSPKIKITDLPSPIIQSKDYLWVKLPKPMTKSEITNEYY